MNDTAHQRISESELSKKHVEEDQVPEAVPASPRRSKPKAHPLVLGLLKRGG